MYKKEDISTGVRLLTWSTSVRWFGWGLGESFTPIFLLLFSTNFFETGLLISVFNLVLFLAIPLAGFLADNIKIKKMILAGLIIYVFIGLGYFLAGVTGAIIFIIIARALNGISYSLDQVGRESFFIRQSPKNKISWVFGQFDYITTIWWLLAVIIGFSLVKFMSVPIHWLFFFVIPTSMISFLIVLKLKERSKNRLETNSSILKIYIKVINNVKNFNHGIKIVLFLSFILGMISSIIYFFVPASSYLKGDGIVNAALLALVYSIPHLFGRSLGKIADSKREKVYLFCFSSLVVLLAGLILLKNYFLVLLIVFIASIIFELLSLTNKGMIARLADRTHLGETDSSLNGVSALGAIVGPLLFGFFVDSIGFSKAYFIIAVLLVVFSIVILKKIKHLK